MQYEGWIVGNNRNKLEKIGVTITSSYTIIGGNTNFEVTLDDNALRKLNLLWGEYYWGLTEVKNNKQ